MTGTEDLLRAAFDSGARAMPSGSDGLDTVRARRRQRAVRRRAALVTTAAALVVAAVALAVPRPGRRAVTDQPVGLAPATFVVLRHSGGAFRLDAADPARPGDQMGPIQTTSAVAAEDDGISYAYAEPVSYRDGNHARCVGSLFPLHYEAVDPGQDPLRLGAQSMVDGPIETDGPVTDIAFTPDGTRIAYVVNRLGPNGGCERAVLHVRDLVTGADRTWTDGYGSPTHMVGATTVGALSWADDNRHLLYVAEACCVLDGGFRILDTTRPGTDYFAGEVLGPQGLLETDGSTCSIAAPAYRGAVPAAVRTCVPPDGGSDPTRYDLVELSPADGTVTRVLTRLPSMEAVGLSFDPSGDHALLVTAARTVLRWDRSGPVRQVLTGADQADW